MSFFSFPFLFVVSLGFLMVRIVVLSSVTDGFFFLCVFKGIANARCLITQMISWYNVKGAKIGKTLRILLCFVY